jgi:squalene cyclase
MYLLVKRIRDPVRHSWGKFWLAILNVHSWRGLNPTPAELWLLPDWLPIHPWRWWIHTRNVYIPMGYLSGKRFQADEDELIRSLRQVRYSTAPLFLSLFLVSSCFLYRLHRCQQFLRCSRTEM